MPKLHQISLDYRIGQTQASTDREMPHVTQRPARRSEEMPEWNTEEKHDETLKRKCDSEHGGQVRRRSVLPKADQQTVGYRNADSLRPDDVRVQRFKSELNV